MPTQPSHKACSKCKAIKPLTEFWKRTSTSLFSECRGCNYERHRNYLNSPDGKRAWKRWKTSIKCKERAQTDYRKFPERMAARNAITSRVYRGIIKRPDRCQTCGNHSSKIEAHHHKGYAFEHRLDVIWVCRECHRAAH